MPRVEDALITSRQQAEHSPFSARSQVEKNKTPVAKKRAGVYCTPQINISPKSGVICPYCIYITRE